MLRLEQVREIRRLLNEDRLSQRQIAQLVGVGRSTVAMMADGRRGDQFYEPPAERPAETAPVPVRCPTCGARVVQPCIACRVRRSQLRLHRADGEGPSQRSPSRVA